MRSRLFGVLAILAGPSGLPAQDRPATIISTSPTPRYPEVLKAAGVSGTVTAWVIVLPGDSVPTGGVRVVASPHPGFRNAAVEGLRRWGYQAAVREGRPVVDSLRVELTYLPSPSPDADFDSVTVRRVRQDEGTVWKASIERARVIGPSEAPTDSLWRAMGVRVMGKVLEEIQGRARGTVPIACVGLERFRKSFPVTVSELQALQRPGIAVVVPERCPPSFASMAYIVGRVIPPGEDPVGVYATEVKVFGGRWYFVTVEARGRTSGTVYECVVDAAGDALPIRCPRIHSWVS